MPVWHETVDLKDVWRAEMSFESKRDMVVQRIKGSEWYKSAQQSTYRGGLIFVVDDLAHSTSVSEFDMWMDEVWDMADTDRVWIETF